MADGRRHSGNFGARYWLGILGTTAIVAACGGSSPGATAVATAGPGRTAGSFAGETGQPGATTGGAQPTAAGPRNLSGTLDPTFIGGFEVAGVATDGQTAWVTDPERDVVVVVDLAAGAVIDEYEVGASPLGIAHADGELWVANSSPGDHRVMRLDAATGEILATITIPAGRSTTGIVVGEGAAWVATSGSGEVVRIGLDTDAIEATIADQDITSPGTIDVVLAFGSVWSIDDLTGSVVRIDPVTNSISDRYADLGREQDGVGGPLRLAAAGSRLWVLSAVSRGRDATGLFTIDPDTGAVDLVAELPIGADPRGLPGLLIDSAGGAWLAVDERLIRFAIQERRADTIETDVALRFSALVEAGDHVWYGMASSFSDDLAGLYGVELARITAP